MEESAEVQEHEAMTDDEEETGEEGAAANVSGMEEDNTIEEESDPLKNLEDAELKKNFERNEDNGNETLTLKDMLSDSPIKAENSNKQELTSDVKVDKDKESLFKEEIMGDNVENSADEMDITTNQDENEEDDDDDIGLALKSLHKDVAEEITKVCKTTTSSPSSNSSTVICTSTATGSCSTIQTVESIGMKGEKDNSTSILETSLNKIVGDKTSSASAEMIDNDDENDKQIEVKKGQEVSMVANEKSLEDHKRSSPSEVSLKKDLSTIVKEGKDAVEQKKLTSESAKLGKDTSISSEERVKNLISEWGDDDDENDEEEEEGDNEGVEGEGDDHDVDDGSDGEL